MNIFLTIVIFLLFYEVVNIMMIMFFVFPMCDKEKDFKIFYKYWSKEAKFKNPILYLIWNKNIVEDCVKLYGVEPNELQ